MTTPATRRTVLDPEKSWSIWDTVTNSRSFVRKCKETGIPFTGPMMKAIRENRKFQTRRLTPFFDFKKIHALDEEPRLELIPADSWRKQKGKLCAVIEWQSEVDDTAKSYYPSRYGQPGDLLWCRHTFARFPELPGMPAGFGYECDLDSCGQVPVNGVLRTWDKVKHTPPMFMPRVASRETLLLTDVRVERVGDISEEDAIAEGVTDPPHLYEGDEDYKDCDPCNHSLVDWVEGYRRLWDSLHGKKAGCSFADSPWVYALTFERIGGTEK